MASTTNSVAASASFDCEAGVSSGQQTSGHKKWVMHGIVTIVLGMVAGMMAFLALGPDTRANLSFQAKSHGIGKHSIVHKFHMLAPIGAPRKDADAAAAARPRVRSDPRCCAPDGDPSEGTDWAEALKEWRSKQPPVAADSTEGRNSSKGSFRFASKRDDTSNFDVFGDPNTVTGSRERDDLADSAIQYGGLALTGIILISCVFYIYVGLSGGITNGFDRFEAPPEDIRETMRVISEQPGPGDTAFIESTKTAQPGPG